MRINQDGWSKMIDPALKVSLEAAAKRYKRGLKVFRGNRGKAEDLAAIEAVSHYIREKDKDPETPQPLVLNEIKNLDWWPPKQSSPNNRHAFLKNLMGPPETWKPWSHFSPNDPPPTKRQTVIKNTKGWSKEIELQGMLEEISELEEEFKDLYPRAKRGDISWEDAYTTADIDYVQKRKGKRCIRIEAKPGVAPSSIIKKVSKPVIKKMIDAWHQIPQEGNDLPHNKKQLSYCLIYSESLARRIQDFTIDDQVLIIKNLEEYLQGNTKPKPKRSKVPQAIEKPSKVNAGNTRASQNLDFQNHVLMILREQGDLSQIELIRSLHRTKNGGVRRRIKKLVQVGIILKDEATGRYRVPDNQRQSSPENPQQEESIKKRRTCKEPRPEIVDIPVRPAKKPPERQDSGNGHRKIDVETESYVELNTLAEKRGLSVDALLKKMLRDAQRPHVKGQRRS